MSNVCRWDPDRQVLVGAKLHKLFAFNHFRRMKLCWNWNVAYWLSGDPSLLVVAFLLQNGCLTLSKLTGGFELMCFSRKNIWSNYSDLTRPGPPKGSSGRKNPLISGKSKVVKLDIAIWPEICFTKLSLSATFQIFNQFFFLAKKKRLEAEEFQLWKTIMFRVPCLKCI